jgi:hypothetical protein
VLGPCAGALPVRRATSSGTPIRFFTVLSDRDVPLMRTLAAPLTRPPSVTRPGSVTPRAGCHLLPSFEDIDVRASPAISQLTGWWR